MLVTAWLELCRDDPLGIGFGGVSEQPQTLRRPQSKKPIAPGDGLEAKFLIVPEPSFELFPALFKDGHVVCSRVQFVTKLRRWNVTTETQWRGQRVNVHVGDPAPCRSCMAGADRQ